VSVVRLAIEADSLEVEITPRMLRAGAEAVAVCLDESSSSFCELVADAVFRAMETCRDTSKNSQCVRRSPKARR